jgi:type VI secretion system secreted protein Hcp
MAMPIYMRITRNHLPVMSGDVTAKGHEKWIELTTVQLGSVRVFNAFEAQDRSQKGLEKEIIITKKRDSASPQLLDEVMNGRGNMKIQIDFVKTGEVTFQTVALQDAVVSGYYTVSGGTDGASPNRIPSESWTLNYAKGTFA